MSSVGDLGRRVEERRCALGLSERELAVRAGMSPTFVGYVESSPNPELSRAALWRLSAALDTSVEALTGGAMEQPPGEAEPSAPAIVESVDTAECLTLIADGGIGRIVFRDDRGPVALPVNFRLLDGDVAILVERHSSLATGAVGNEVAFEVDRIDNALSEGWSVLMTGTYRVTTEPEAVEAARSGGLRPWAGGLHDALVTISARQITGRRIRRPPVGTADGWGRTGV
jgi:nitroimidazol reductase NimA-like FMN-containing flavoprotein (pyridoxamine 5'-phosphate oxidase superfamily)